MSRNTMQTEAAYGYARRFLRAHGRSPAIGTSFRPIWDVAGAFNWMPFGVTDRFQVSSSSASDAAAGTGAKTVVVVGIDGNGLEVEVTVTLTGQTPVEIVPQLHHVNRFYVTAAGSAATGLATNVGDLYISRLGTSMAAGVPTVAGDIFAKAVAESGGSQGLCFVVPSDRSAAPLSLTATVGPDARGDFRLEWQEVGGVVRRYLEFDVRGAQLIYDPVLTTKIPGGSRVWMSAKLSTGSDEIHAELSLALM